MPSAANGLLKKPVGQNGHAVPISTRQQKDGAQLFTKGPYLIEERAGAKKEEKAATWTQPSLQSDFLCFSNALNLALWVAYTLYQARYARALSYETGKIVWFYWLAIAGELTTRVLDMFISFEVLMPRLFRCTGNASQIQHYNLLGDVAPSIDVMIPCCGEPVDVVMDTVKAAAAQTYPSESYRVFVLDDGKTKELEDAVEAWIQTGSGKKRPFVKYVSREKKPGARHYYKAGNLHHGVEVSSTLGSSSEYVAAIDADMILRLIVPHLIVGDDMALACPPQQFYNVPETDPICQESFIFVEILEPLKRQINWNCCSGSGYILRRSALPDIGGLPLVDVGEDIILSAMLHNAGWKVAFAEETIQHGLVPDTYESYIKQRMRWTDGTMLLTRYFSYYMPWARNVKNLTLAQRCAEWMHVGSKIGTVLITCFLLIFPIALVQASTAQEATTSTRSLQYAVNGLFMLHFAWFRFNRFLIFSRVGTSSVTLQSKVRIALAPYIAIRTILAAFPGTDSFHFESTGSLITNNNERSVKRRRSLPRRLLNIDSIMRIAYVILAVAVIATWGLRRTTGEAEFHLSPLMSAVLAFIHITVSSALPVLYMIFPPDVAEREDLMEEDEHGIMRPKADAVRSMGIENNFRDIVFEVGIILLCGFT